LIEPYTNFNCKQLLDANVPHRPVFVANGLKDDTWQGSYLLVPSGLVLRVYPTAHTASAAAASSSASSASPFSAVHNASTWLQQLIAGHGLPRTDAILRALRPSVYSGY
jgi:hypothetical protein